MGHIMHGIKELYLAAGGADFPGTAVGVHGMGYDGKGSLIISEFNAPKGDKGRVFPGARNFKIEKSTNQFTQAFVAFLLNALKANDISAVLVSSGVAKGETDYTSTGGIFTFENAKSLGIGMELNITEKEAWIKLVLEKAFRRTTADAMLAAAKNETLPIANALPALNAAALLVSDVTPAFGTLAIAEDRLNSFKVNIKEVGSKNGYNKTLCSRLAVTIEGIMSGPDPDEIVEILDFEIAPDVTITVPLAAPYDLVFKSGTLSKVGDVEITDDKREGKVTLQGEVDLDLIDTTTGGDITFKAQL